VLRDVLKKWEIEHDFNGSQFIPKSISLFTVQDMGVITKLEINYGKFKKIISEGRYEFNIDPKVNIFQTEEQLPVQQKLARLEQQIDQLSKRIGIIENGDNIYLRFTEKGNWWLKMGGPGDIVKSTRLEGIPYKDKDYYSLTIHKISNGIDRQIKSGDQILLQDNCCGKGFLKVVNKVASL
jgi:hypothetical protein